MNKMRCIIVDDEPLAVELMAGYVRKTPSLELVGTYTDPVAALSEIRSTLPDLVFMDIQMPDLNGLELSRMLPEQTMVVFTTAFREYAFDSYEVDAVDYLHSHSVLHLDLKPDNIMITDIDHSVKIIDLGLLNKQQIRPYPYVPSIGSTSTHTTDQR